MGTGTETFKPSWAAVRRGPAGWVGFIIAASVVGVFIQVDAVSAGVLALIGIAFLAVLTVVVLRGRLEVRPGEVVLRGWVGTRQVTSSDLDRIVWLPALESPNLKFVVGSRLVCVGHDGKAVFKLTSRIWSTDAVAAAAQALAAGTRVVALNRRVTVLDVMVVEPVALTWTERNPIKTGVLGFLGFFAAFALLFGASVLYGWS